MAAAGGGTGWERAAEARAAANVCEPGGGGEGGGAEARRAREKARGTTWTQRKLDYTQSLTLATLLILRWQVILVHGNGPQVGILALMEQSYSQQTGTVPYTFDCLGYAAPHV